MATRKAGPPAFADRGGFTEVPIGNYVWRDNALILVPAQLYVHQAVAGQKISVSLGDRDAVVLIKSGP